MSNVYPALGSFYRNSSRAVFHFGYGVVYPGAYDLFFGAEHGVCDILAQREAYAATRASRNKIVLRAGIESVFSVNKLGAKHYVALLGGF